MFKRLFAVLRANRTGKGETPPTPAASRAEPRRVEEGRVLASSSPTRAERNPSPEQIAVHAYHRWLSRGKPVGTDWEGWFEAERQLRPAASA
jgi:hypothetical protein